MEELNLKELLELFWSKKFIIMMITIVFILAGIIYSRFFMVPEYKASTTLVLAKTSSGENTTNSITATDVTVNEKLVSTYSELIKSRTVLRQVIDNVDIKGLEEETLRDNISVASVKDTELIKITVVNTKPNDAANIANEIANVFSNTVDDMYNMNNVHVVDRASVPTSTSNMSQTKLIGVCMIVGLMVSILCIFTLNLFDSSIKNAKQIEKLTGLPVLAQIPECDFEKIGGKQ